LHIMALLVAIQAASAFSLDLGATIAHVNKLGTTWTAGINERFVNVTFEQAKRLCGSLEGGEKLAEREFSAEELAMAVPTDFDARSEWGKLCPTVNEVRDQSDCGSCWAFGAVEAASDRICVQSKGADKYRASAQDLLACCSSCGMGCNGGYPNSAWSWLANTGVVTGGDYKDLSLCQAYSMAPCDHHVVGKYGPCPSSEYPTPKCARICDGGSSYNVTYSNDKRKFKRAYSVSGVEKIQTDIMTSGPVEASFTVYNDFLTYKSGVYQHVSGSALGGHAIKILGWGVEGTTPYWLVANSWNEGWGDKGFFKILRGKNECGIEGNIVAGQWA